MKKSLFRVLSVLALVILLINPVLAAAGAKSGLILWAQAVLPALLPFMICSNVIVALDAINILIFPVKWLLSSLLSLSDAGSYVLVSGLLCGYPMGAKTCSEFMDEGRLTVREGNYLAAICNHPSPMFLLGYAASLFPKDIPVFIMLLSIYLPILPLAGLAKKYYLRPSEGHELSGCPAGYKIGRNTTEASILIHKKPTFDESLMSSCDTMIKIGSYIMLFSILAALINKLPIPWISVKAVLLSTIEITTGIQAVSSVMPGYSGAMVICAALSFGGFSGIFQTKSVMKNAGLSIRHYIIWKVLHSILSCIIFVLLMAARQGP